VCFAIVNGRSRFEEFAGKGGWEVFLGVKVVAEQRLLRVPRLNTYNGRMDHVLKHYESCA